MENFFKVVVGDIKELIKSQNSYDIVVFGAVVDVLGDSGETIIKLKNTINQRGYILIHDAYGKKGSDIDDFTKQEWSEIHDTMNNRLI